MLAQLEARLAAVRSVAEKHDVHRLKAMAGLVAMAVMLGSCLPRPVPLVGADPADPGVNVAGVGYRSTVTPYIRLRPTAPSSWRQRRDPAPASKSGE